MLLPKFKIEEFFAQYEFIAPYMLGSSDAETWSLHELLQMADRESAELWNNLKFSYTEILGLPMLREEISKLYKLQNKDNILVFSGAEEAIFVTMNVLLKPGDEVVILTPCYQSLNAVPNAIGASATEFNLDWQDGKWSFDLARFASTITAQTKLVILNFPHNPTGFLPDQKLFAAIIEIVKQQGAYLFCDEVYRLSEHNPADCLPNAVDCYVNALSLGVMSKAYGLPGLRIGWVASTNQELLQNLASYKHYTTICNSAPSEILSLIALRNKDIILQRNIALAKRNLDLLDKFFSQYTAIYEWYRPNAGFINFPRLKLAISINEFVDKLIKEEGVVMVPGTVFDNQSNHFRLGFGRANLPEALTRLERFTIKYLNLKD